MTAASTVTHRFLMVEDNPDNAEFATWLLEDEGYEVDCAETGELGLKMLEEYEYSLILMDISLPGMDGNLVIQTIRSQDKHSGIPIIAVTAHAIPAECREVLESGADYVITKPIDEDALLDAISKSLRGELPSKH